jgi:type I restriction enzyme M protein
MLVKESLIAVVSLPAGVFSPYSGVKTSILLLDKKLAKQTDKILFVKVENDGFDLGAQRREIDRNDLPNATSLILAFKQMLRKEITENKLAKLMEKTKLGALVEKEIILANKDVVLSAERYIESNSGFVTNIPIVKLEEIATFEYGYTASARDEGEARFIRITDIDKHYRLKEDESKYIDLNKDNKKYLVKVGDILIARTGATYGKTVLIENDIKGIFASYLIRMKFNHSVLLPKLFWYFTQTDYYWNQAKNLVSGGGQPQFNSNVIKEIQIPLPPMEVQKAIVTEIESYQKIIDGARQVVENYKPRITINPKWKMVELGNVVNKVSDLIEPQKNKGTVSYIGLENIGQGNGKLSTNELSKTDYQNIKSTKIVFKKNDILYGKLRPNLNKVWLAEFDGICSTDIFVLRSNTKVINPNYLSISLLSDEFNKIVLNGIKGAQLPRVAFDYFETLTIPLPDLKVQEKIVDETKIELAAVESNKTLIEMFEGKIKSKIAEVWGEL